MSPRFATASLSAAVLIGCLAAGVGVRAQAPDSKPVLLKDGTAAGDVADVETDFHMAMEIKASRGKETAPSMEMTSHQTQRYREETLSRDAKGVTALRRTYQVAKEYEKNPDGVKNRVLSLQGKTLVLKRVGGKPVLTVLRGKLSPEDRKDVLDDLDGNRLPFFSRKPVAVGEEWTVDQKDLRMLFDDLGKEGKVDVQARLDELTVQNGHPVARVHVRLHVERQAPEQPAMTMDLQGDLIHRTDIQRTVSVDLVGPTTLRGETEGFHMEGEGTTEMKWRFKPVKLAGKPYK